MPPDPVLLGFMMFATTAIQMATQPKPPKPPPLLEPPQPPELEDPAIAAARRRQLAASGGGGRGSTIIAGRGARPTTLETEKKTLLGGA